MNPKTIKESLHHRSVKIALHERLRGSQEQRKGGKVLHASSITDDNGFCAREFCLLSFLEVKPRHETISTSLQFTFDIGNAAQGIITNYLEDLLWGTWKCVHCEDESEEMRMKPRECYYCGSGNLTYIEPRFTSNKSGISGGVDLIVKFPGHEKMRAIELKTMNQASFKELKAPLQKHRLRTNLYLRVIEETEYADLIDTTEASVLYCDKGFGCKDDGTLEKFEMREPTSPFKEYVVKRDDPGLANVLLKAAPLTPFREKGIMPGLICAGIADKRADKCPVKSDCFSGKYPAGQVVKLL